MSKISKSVLDKIKKGKVKPRPKWQFVLLHVSFAAAGVLSVFIGGLAVGAIIREVFGTEWNFVGHIHGNRAVGLMMVLPYIWFGVLALTLFLGKKCIAHTKKGYKYRHVILTIVLLSTLLGSGLYCFGASHGVENMMRDHIGPYDDFQKSKAAMWINPENGILVGEIIEIESDTFLIINTMTEEEWTIDIFDAQFVGQHDPETGEHLITSGEISGEMMFDADKVKLFDPSKMPPHFHQKKDERKGNKGV